MAIRRVSTLTSTIPGETYATVDEWKASHGNCGTAMNQCQSATLTLNEDGVSVTRTLIFANEAQKDSYKAENIVANVARNYTTTHVETNNNWNG